MKKNFDRAVELSGGHRASVYTTWAEAVSVRTQNRSEFRAMLERALAVDRTFLYTDLERGRIYATGIGSANERLTIAHEYLHFALANHPRGRDEDFIERTARTLLDMP